MPSMMQSTSRYRTIKIGAPQMCRAICLKYLRQGRSLPVVPSGDPEALQSIQAVLIWRHATLAPMVRPGLVHLIAQEKNPVLR